jgi:hypothetical protein
MKSKPKHYLGEAEPKALGLTILVVFDFIGVYLRASAVENA